MSRYSTLQSEREGGGWGCKGVWVSGQAGKWEHQAASQGTSMSRCSTLPGEGGVEGGRFSGLVERQGRQPRHRKDQVRTSGGT